MIKALVMSAMLAATGSATLAQGLEAAEARLDMGLFAGQGPDTLARLTVDTMTSFRGYGLQFSATTGLVGIPPDETESDGLSDARLILFSRIRPNLSFGTEVQYSTDRAFGDAEVIFGMRMRYDTGNTVIDGRYAMAHLGPTGAFSVTFVLEEQLTPRIRTSGLIHRYSTDAEIGDYYIVGLGAEMALSDSSFAYGDWMNVLADDYSYNSNVQTIGLGYNSAPGHRYLAGLTRRDTNSSQALGLTVGVEFGFGRTGDLFATDLGGLSLAHLGH